MERTRVAKVDDVRLVRRGQQIDGSIHLTPHHLIFVHQPPTSPSSPGSSKKAAKPRPREIWITYPIIQTCTLRLSPSWSAHLSSIRLKCRDFNFYCFRFGDEKKARDVFDSIKSWTCKIGRVDRLYAFSYLPQQPEKEVNGWTIYNPQQEFRRMGISEKDSDKGWRISTLNNDYSLSPTYPSMIVVPSSISDNTLKFAGKYRSRVRLPVLTYLHPVNNCSITRCAQPMVGVRQHRSIQDEKLLAAIFSVTNSRDSPEEAEQVIPGTHTPRLSESDSNTAIVDANLTDIEAAEDAIIAEADVAETETPRVYGAQRNNLIVDARPTVNAIAMHAMGMGTEIMDNYPFAEKVYLGIANIHVMRESLNKVTNALKESDITPLGPNRELLIKSGWIKHIANMLDGVGIIVRQVGIQHSNVLIHCSDGWDRTSQLSALSQLCLDPYYRTFEGFMVLVEKDWLSFGHMFATRSGHLSSENWFSVENERSVESDKASKDGPGAAIEGAFLKAKGFFSKENTKSRESLVESDNDANPMDTTSKKELAGDKHKTKVNETSPIFHQFLDATYQLLYQNPNRFEFNERFLRRLLYHLYSCQYGTFLYNSERERQEHNISTRTRSVWDYFLSRKAQFINPTYDSIINDHERGKERIILPKPTETRWWNELFGREDHEMNALTPPGLPNASSNVTDSGFATASNSTDNLPGHSMALTGVETAEKVIMPGIIPTATAPRSGTASPARQIQSNRLGSGASPFARFDNVPGSSRSPKPALANTTTMTPKIEDGLADLHVSSIQHEGSFIPRAQLATVPSENTIVQTQPAAVPLENTTVQTHQQPQPSITQDYEGDPLGVTESGNIVVEHK